jgi:four helix bundle protein
MGSAPRSSQPVRSVRDLRAWQEAMQLVVALQPVCVALERAHRTGLAEQLRRAATSVHANIAEGWGRPTPPDRQRFYAMAWASLLETESLLAEVALTSSSASTVGACTTHARHAGRLLAALRRAARTSRTLPR